MEAREVKKLAQGQSHSEEWSQDSNPGSLILESVVLTTFITKINLILPYTIYFMLFTYFLLTSVYSK